MLRVGDAFDRFVVEAVIGEGGRGVVYRARDTRLERRLALKVLRPELGSGTDEEARAALLREAQLAAAFDHPNAVAIFDVGEIEGTLYIAMELVEGRSLRELADAGELPPLGDRTRILLDVARALEAAHERGLVHRDVKPENVMVRPDGVVKVLDFGIAKKMKAPLDDDGGSVTEAGRTTADGRRGTVSGTPRYMSPEHIKGEAADARSDQFSWGVLAYELLGGRSPWHGAGEGVQLLVAVVSSKPVPLRDLAPEVPRAVAAIVKRCMAKAPDQRFGSMREVIEGLEQALPPRGSDASMPRSTSSGRLRAGGPTSRPPGMDAGSGGSMPGTTTTAKNVEPARRSPSLVATGVAAVTVVALVALGAGLLRRGDPEVTATADQEGGATAGGPIARGAGAAAGAASAAGNATPTAITALPPPTSSKPEALVQFQAGMQAFRDATFESARRAFARAVEIDPQLAAAHLRVAVMDSTVGNDQADSRRSYKLALQHRGSLSARDQILLDALEPYFQGDPPDLRACEERLVAATGRYSGDSELAYYLGFVRLERGHLKDAIAAFERALALDPALGEAWALKAGAHLYAGDFDRAQESLRRCADVSPAATDCMWYRTLVADQQGRCADLEADVRRWIAKDSDDYYGYHLLAKSLVAQRRDPTTVRSALEQKWAKQSPERAQKARLIDEVHVALLAGDFAAAEKGARELEKRAAGASDAYEHWVPAFYLLDVYSETGEKAKAQRLAEDLVRRRDTWIAPHRVEDSAILNDPEPALLGVLARGGALAPAALETKRADWLKRWEAKTSEGYFNYLWITAYAFPAQTAAEATNALDALSRYTPTPPFLSGARASSSIAHTYALAGRNDDALAYARRATEGCSAFEDPVPHTRAYLDLATAYAAKGEAEAACASLHVVEQRWGRAVPRSATLSAAQALAARLNCVRGR